ncbi:MAG: type 1 glutamine amidotransferase [Bacteroidia bacterium]
MKLKLAILDMNAAVANQGMRCIQEITGEVASHFDIDVFDVRAGSAVPDLSYDVYISSGGPGSPYDGDGDWNLRWKQLLDDVLAHNQQPGSKKKFMFLICHSFQMACIHFGVGSTVNRNGRSFGVLPVYKTHEGAMEPLFSALPDPLYAVDVRDWQVVDVDFDALREKAIKVLAIEQPREKPNLPRAIMAVRFSPEIIGTQFHPEADADGMLRYYQQPEKRKETIDTYGEGRYHDILNHLNDEDKVLLTHATILPGFIGQALSYFEGVRV